jgi:hypothetical protein
MKQFLALAAGTAVAFGAALAAAPAQATLAAARAPAAQAAGMPQAGTGRGAARATPATCPAEITHPDVVIKTRATVDYAFTQTCGATYGEWLVYGPSSQFDVIEVPPGGFFDPDGNVVQYDFESSQENRGLCVLEPDGLWDASGNPVNDAQATEYFYLKSGTAAGIHGYRSGGQAVLRVHVLWFGWPAGGSGGGSWLPAGGRTITFWEKRHGAWRPVSGAVRTDASGNARLRVPESWEHYFRVQVAETQRLWGDTSSPARV